MIRNQVGKKIIPSEYQRKVNEKTHFQNWNKNFSLQPSTKLSPNLRTVFLKI